MGSNHISFEIPEGHLSVGCVGAMRLLDPDGNYKIIINATPDTDGLTAASLGRLIADRYHYQILRTIKNWND